MSTPKYVQHDEKRWKVTSAITLDDRPAFDLVRYTIVWNATRTKHEIRKLNIVAYADECAPDQHEQTTKLRDDTHVLIFNKVRKTVLVRGRGRSKGFKTTLAGIYAMCARQQASNKKREKDFRRRTGKKG